MAAREEVVVTTTTTTEPTITTTIPPPVPVVEMPRERARPPPEQRYGTKAVFHPHRHDELEPAPVWTNRTRIVLYPTSSPWVLGLFAYGIASFVWAGRLANWYGDSFTSWGPLSSLIFFIGGIAQILSSMWSFRARDALGTAFHGIWGATWLALGLFFLMVAIGAIANNGYDQSDLGFWFVALAIVTWLFTFAAFPCMLVLVIFLALLSVSCILLAIAFIHDVKGVAIAGGWFMVFSSFFAFYGATAFLLESSFQHVVLPLTKWGRKENTPGSVVTIPIEYHDGLPGSRVQL